jgi:hypothetical protein
MKTLRRGGDLKQHSRSWPRRLRIGFIATILVTLGPVGYGLAADIAADVVISNARVYTVNATKPWAEAVAIRGDKIVAVGSAKALEPYRGPATHVIDAGGRLVLPAAGSPGRRQRHC